jgi:hypothetical protein
MAPKNIEGDLQILGMGVFWLAFGVALIVTMIETIVMIFRMIRVNLRGGVSAKTIPMSRVWHAGFNRPLSKRASVMQTGSFYILVLRLGAMEVTVANMKLS